MAYFPNGISGRLYEEDYCDQCVHRNGPDGKTGCAVWLAHLLYSYAECNETSNAKSMLDMLIPMDKDGNPLQCAMYHEGEAVPTDEEKHRLEKLRRRNYLPSIVKWAAERNIQL